MTVHPKKKKPKPKKPKKMSDVNFEVPEESNACLTKEMFIEAWEEMSREPTGQELQYQRIIYCIDETIAIVRSSGMIVCFDQIRLDQYKSIKPPRSDFDIKYKKYIDDQLKEQGVL